MCRGHLWLKSENSKFEKCHLASKIVDIVCFLLVTAAVWREPQLTAMISHDGETSSRAGNAWIDMNTSSSCFPPSCGSSVDDAPVQYS